MSDKKDNSVLEIIAIAAVILLLWKLFSKKQKPVLQSEPVTTAPELSDLVNKQPACDKFIYKPLSPWGPFPSNLYGPGWCYVGDGTFIDTGAGFGDAYAEEQAQAYQDQKQTEAIRVINKKFILFKLINTTAAKVTTGVLDTVNSPQAAFNPIPDVPVAISATSLSDTSFDCNWNLAANASGYYLDVASDNNFLSMVAGYNNLDVGNVLTKSVTGLSEGTTYYYRVRAYNAAGTSNSSNVITQATLMLTVTDIDGNVYDLITVNNQQWIVQNLRTTKYKDGTAIPNLTLDADWSAEDGTPGHDGAYCYYNNDGPTYGADYGKLYNWYAVNNSKGLAPEGFRVATSADIISLATYLGATPVAGGKLKETGTSHWDAPNTGATDEIGFALRGNGYRLAGIGFFFIKQYGALWSATEVDALNATWFTTQHNTVALSSSDVPKTYGYAVRCVRDV